ncbi:MAG: nickel pincer cofactor biosynthesis protein LarB [Anaerolineales bacterium]|nr:nickel pincer cofactor biosynthesis protein LarB [Anaerolineales bacterium]
MDIEKLEQLLTGVQSGQIDVAQAMERLRGLPYEDMGHTRLDLHRSLRQGLPEVIFCQNKTVEQVVAILDRLSQHHDRVLATRVSTEMAAAVRAQFPQAHYDPVSRLLTLTQSDLPSPAADAPYVLVVTGGTSDLPVAEEAAQTAEFLGSRVERAYDVGVAGVHRLLDQRERLFSADVVISVAGMEGALTSVVGGLVSCPVIGVPTSVGYGAHFGGLAPLLAMLNSCATGVAVVNIDNGFGAGVFAHLILRKKG